MSDTVLIIDDEDVFREDLAELLRHRGYTCWTACDGLQGMARVDEFAPDVVLCDVVMPGVDGIEVLDRIMRVVPETCVIMITAHGRLETAVAALRRGASDYIMKPLSVEDVVEKIRRIMEHKRLAQEVKFLRREVSRGVETRPLIGRSDPARKVLELIQKVAATRSMVLLRGESGTGKEIVARMIAATGDPPGAPFMAVNCAGIPEHLLQSEFFGHVQGAFTGAIANKEGFFELAGEGTAFLDEISEMPLALQAKLLRVLEEREFVRVGGTRSIPLRSRVIVSTNRDLRELVQAGRFREDLLFRVAVFEIVLPTLRERREDIPLLIEHFVRVFTREMKRKCLGADNHAIRMLMAYSWPGNVRELRNVVERAMILTTSDYITSAELPAELAGRQDEPDSPDDLRAATRAYESEHIRRVLAASGGNKEEAARRLRINPSTLYRKMADLGLEQRDP